MSNSSPAPKPSKTPKPKRIINSDDTKNLGPRRKDDSFIFNKTKPRRHAGDNTHVNPINGPIAQSANIPSKSNPQMPEPTKGRGEPLPKKQGTHEASLLERLLGLGGFGVDAND